MVLIFSALISGWTSIVLLSNTSFNLEIKQVIHKMYLNQKNFIFNVKDLSILLLSNTTFKLEIKQVIHKMYLNQKNFIFNVKDLSLLLVKDANERLSK